MRYESNKFWFKASIYPASWRYWIPLLRKDFIENFGLFIFWDKILLLPVDIRCCSVDSQHFERNCKCHYNVWTWFWNLTENKRKMLEMLEKFCCNNIMYTKRIWENIINLSILCFLCNKTTWIQFILDAYIAMWETALWICLTPLKRQCQFNSNFVFWAVWDPKTEISCTCKTV